MSGRVRGSSSSRRGTAASARPSKNEVPASALNAPSQPNEEAATNSDSVPAEPVPVPEAGTAAAENAAGGGGQGSSAQNGGINITHEGLTNIIKMAILHSMQAQQQATASSKP